MFVTHRINCQSELRIATRLEIQNGIVITSNNDTHHLFVNAAITGREKTKTDIYMINNTDIIMTL